MSKKRKLQFYRNDNINIAESHNSAKLSAQTVFNGQLNGMDDGEILLYRYRIEHENGLPVHTIIGVVRNDGVNQYVEIYTNFDILIKNSVGLTDDFNYLPNNALIANKENISDAVDELANIVDDKIVQIVAYANSLIEQGTVTPIQYVPSLMYVPQVITDTTTTAATLNPIIGNAVYIFTQPLTELNILNISALYLETTIYFTTHSTTTFSYTLPQGVYKANIIKFIKGCHYCMSIKDGVVCLEKIDRYLDEPTFIFSSEQLTDGLLKSRPEIVEVSGSTPVISTTKPYTIYKFGEITSLTMSQIPANTLETIAYFSSPPNESVTLILSGLAPLKISSGSVTSLRNGSFCLVIKDGVIVINEIKTL